jgi:hypothetical protein
MAPALRGTPGVARCRLTPGDGGQNLLSFQLSIIGCEATLDANPEAQRSLADLRVRLIDLQPTVRLSVAADLLEISLPTIRAWMEDGPLCEAGDSSPRLVSLESVLEVRPVLRDLRELGRDRNLLAAVTDRLEDERDLADPELQRSLEEMRRGDLIDV